MIRFEKLEGDSSWDPKNEEEVLFQLLKKYKNAQDMRIDCMLEISKLKRSLEQTLTDAEMEQIKKNIEGVVKTAGALKTEMEELKTKIEEIEDRAENA